MESITMNEKPKNKPEQLQSSQSPALSNNTTPDVQVSKTIKPSARYSEAGGKFAGIAGALAGLVYSMSSANPNRGSFLSLNQSLTIGGVAFVFCLLGAGIGYAMGRLVEKMGSVSQR
jgi:hypothetical protein